jgi:hypothetical protein
VTGESLDEFDAVSARIIVFCHAYDSIIFLRQSEGESMFTIGGGTAQVLRTLVASKMLGWKLPQTRDGYLELEMATRAAE